MLNCCPTGNMDALSQTGLMRRVGGPDSALQITNKGYEFMLRDTHVQAWMFVLALVEGYGKQLRSASSVAVCSLDLCLTPRMSSLC